MKTAILPEDVIGSCLQSVSELLFVDQDEPVPPMREAVTLNFGSRTILIQALTDTSELQISIGQLAVVEPDHVIRDASHDDHFRPFLGLPLRNWWIAENDRGYSDAFITAFAVTRGLCFVAMNNIVSVLTVSGEQFS